MMLRIYLACARACYASVVIVAAVIAALGAYLFVVSLFGSYSALVTALAFFPFLIVVSLALRRKLSGNPLLPHPADHGEWMFVFFMFFPAVFAHLLVFIVGLALYQYRYVYPDRDVEGGPMAFFIMIAAGCYLVTMLMGEFGLRHDKAPPSQSRIKSPSARADALSGNTLDSSADDGTPR